MKKAQLSSTHDHTRLKNIKDMLASVGEMAKDTLQLNGTCTLPPLTCPLGITPPP